jgi:hypothetical protein
VLTGGADFIQDSRWSKSIPGVIEKGVLMDTTRRCSRSLVKPAPISSGL